MSDICPCTYIRHMSLEGGTDICLHRADFFLFGKLTYTERKSIRGVGGNCCNTGRLKLVTDCVLLLMIIHASLM